MVSQVRRGAAEIAAGIRQEILSGAFAPGVRLPAERQLAEALQVARGTVRAGINLLQSEGLLEIRPGSGAYVLDPGKATSQQDSKEYSEEHEGFSLDIIADARPFELIDTRFALEPHICRLAVLHATFNDFKQIDSLLGEMEQSEDDPVRFSKADAAFHMALARSTDNRLLAFIIAEINKVRNHTQWVQMRHRILTPAVIRDYNRHHRAIIDAIRAREAEQAASQMKTHLESVRLSLTRSAAT